MADKLPRGVKRRPDGVLEKKTPHFDIGEVRAIVAKQGRKCFTATAAAGYLAMRLRIDQVIESIVQMDAAECFYKAMTSLNDSSLWQDVYHVPTPNGEAYVKFQVVQLPGQAPKAVIQFKVK